MFFQSKRYNVLDQRYNVAFFAAVFAFLSAIVYSSELYDVFTYYILLAITFDQFARIIKPASMNEQAIYERHKMTTEQIEAYVKSKRTYRLIAASIASIIGLVALLLGYEFGFYFVLSCAATWCIYPFIRKLFLRIPAPKLIRSLTNQEWQEQTRRHQNSLNDRYYDPLTPGTLGYDVNRIHNMMNSINSHLKNLR